MINADAMFKTQFLLWLMESKDVKQLTDKISGWRIIVLLFLKQFQKQRLYRNGQPLCAWDYSEV